MRILLVSDTYAPSVNGVAIFTARLAHRLGERGHDVHVLVPRWPGQPSSERRGTHTVHRVPSLPTIVHPAARACLWYGPAQAAALLTRLRPDVVHLQTHFSLGSAVARAAARRCVPVLGTFHVRPENLLLQLPLVPWLRNALARLYWAHLRSVYRAYALVTVPAASAKTFLEHVGVAVPVRVISNGVDVAQFTPTASAAGPAGAAIAASRPQDEHVRQKYGLRHKRLALYVGRLDRDKGLDLLGDVIRGVAAGTDAHFVICGAGREKDRLSRVIAACRLDDRVSFTGWVPATDLPSIYRLASLLVMTGRAETQPLAALEAMASGLPIVALATPGLADVVVNGVTGVLIPPESSAALEGEVWRLWEDAAVRERMACNARDYAVAAHDFERTVSQFVECYGELGTSRRPVDVARPGAG